MSVADNKNIFHFLRRDAMAGVVTGFMAVPLTVGICLMSEYPVMMGLYTVIFACIIGFISYLVKPGNYVGTPGVAAGLAPALAMGIHTFGMENMPFVIFLTATFQAIVWKFRMERYILRLVPHYLVEGLLAGVGLKIALKFIPFLYDIEHETDVWLNYEREVVLVLSIVSFVLFVLLYKYYQKKLPALPYFVIIASSVALNFMLPLPKISIDQIPFQLAIPLPAFSGLDQSEMFFTVLKMIGFAMMLGTIDVIEQVMSNVAIEKLDPYGRKCDTNNSLFAIWVSNMGATFFGGMTNLDGLSKSTTNAVAGAVTKLSNLFTALVLLIVVLYPQILSVLPEYALGIIMVYSGWKMIANIAHVRAEGRYALILAGICGLAVFKLGIFEGLLLVLAGHAIIQYIFMRRLGKSNSEIINQFKSSFKQEGAAKHLDETDVVVAEPDVPILDKWLKAINGKNTTLVMELYHADAVMVPAFSSEIREGKHQIKDFFRDLLAKDNLSVSIVQKHTQKSNGLKIDNGEGAVSWTEGGFEEKHDIRFSIVIKNGKIMAHHFSIVPTMTLEEQSTTVL